MKELISRLAGRDTITSGTGGICTCTLERTQYRIQYPLLLVKKRVQVYRYMNLYRLIVDQKDRQLATRYQVRLCQQADSLTMSADKWEPLLDDVRWRSPEQTAEKLSARLSRSLTIYEALRRLNLLERRHLVLHIIGADAREGKSFDETCAVFGPLCSLLVEHKCCCKVSLLLCGPNLPPRLLGLHHERRCKGMDLVLTYRG